MSTRSRSYKEGLLRRLKDNSEAANYLEAAIEDSSAAFLVALKNVADARSVASIARMSNVNREHIYRTLVKTGNPTINTLEKILRAMGLRLAIGLENESAAREPEEEPRCLGPWQNSPVKRDWPFHNTNPAYEYASKMFGEHGIHKSETVASDESIARHVKGTNRLPVTESECYCEMVA